MLLSTEVLHSLFVAMMIMIITTEDIRINLDANGHQHCSDAIIAS